MDDMAGVLFFDGKCGMCTRARNRLVRLDRTGRVQTEPLQRPGAAERVGVDAERLSQAAWWLDSSGAVYSGAKAVNAALSAALGTRLPLLVYSLPGIGCGQERVYRWIAENRYRFRGVTPWCESAPQQCA